MFFLGPVLGTVLGGVASTVGTGVAASVATAATAASVGGSLASSALGAAAAGTAAAMKTAATVSKVVEGTKALEVAGIVTSDLTTKSALTATAKAIGDELTKEGIQHVANAAMVGKMVYDKGKKDGAEEAAQQMRQYQYCQQEEQNKIARLQALRELKAKKKEIAAAQKTLADGAQAIDEEINRLSY